jgi:hypothetical protein
MDFGQIVVADCNNVLPLLDPRCADAAFAIANPTICPNGTGGLGGTLLLKPGTALACTLGSIQFSAVLVNNGQENAVNSNITFSSSDTSVAIIGAMSGNATGVGAGETIITAIYVDPATGNILTATASLTVLAGTNCCSEVTVAIMLVIDVTLSMSQAFGGSYSTRLAFAIAAAKAFLNQIDSPNVQVGLMTFYDGVDTILVAPTTNIQSVIAALANVTQTQQITGFNKPLTDAITALQATNTDEQIIALISDGEDTSQYDPTDANDAIATSANFQATGGIVMALGCRAGDGFLLLEALATGGFFINAYPAVVTQALSLFNGLKGYVCAGNCTPAGNVTQPTPQLDYCAFENWWISQGTVDLLGPGLYNVLPGNGLYVDLIGGTEGGISLPDIAGNFYGGLMTSRDSFALTAGHQYRLSVSLAGNQAVNVGGTVHLKVFSFNADGLANPNVAPNVVVNESGSPLATTPTYEYVYTWENDNGETIASPITAVTPTTAGATMTINPFNNPGGGKIRIYRTSGISPTSPFYLIATISNGSFSQPATYTDEMNEADMLAALVAGTVEACANPPPYNTTASVVYYLNQSVSVADYQQDFLSQSFTFTTPNDAAVYLSIQQVSNTAVPGLLLGSVNFYDATTLTTFLNDTFATENEQYVPPACGGGTSGGVSYYGYSCYGEGCLNSSPPGAQLPDPNQLPNIEVGYTPPTTYSSTQQACVSCPTGLINLPTNQESQKCNTEQLIPGDFSIGVPGGISATAVIGYFVLNFTNNNPGPLGTFIVTATGELMDGTVVWTQEFQVSSPNGSTGDLAFLVNNPQTINGIVFTLGTSNSGALNVNLCASLFPAIVNQVCATATATSTSSQAAADAAALAQAQALAQQQLNCVGSYTATESYTANCPPGLSGAPVTKTATYTSLISQLDAQQQATAVAQAEAVALLQCQCANTNGQNTTFGLLPPAEPPGIATPYPSVYCASGLNGSITKVTLTLTGLTATNPAAVNVLLVSPSGQAVYLMGSVGSQNLGVTNINLTFDDTAGSEIPAIGQVVGGTFKPSVYEQVTPLPSPAPAPPGVNYATTLASFIGENPNGGWLLYICDDEVQNTGSLASWSIDITT